MKEYVFVIKNVSWLPHEIKGQGLGKIKKKNCKGEISLQNFNLGLK